MNIQNISKTDKKVAIPYMQHMTEIRKNQDFCSFIVI